MGCTDYRQGRFRAGRLAGVEVAHEPATGARCAGRSAVGSEEAARGAREQGCLRATQDGIVGVEALGGLREGGEHPPAEGARGDRVERPRRLVAIGLFEQRSDAILDVFDRAAAALVRERSQLVEQRAAVLGTIVGVLL